MGQGYELVEPAVLTSPSQTSQTEHSLTAWRLLAVELLRIILRRSAVHGRSIAERDMASDPGRRPSLCHNMPDRICLNMRSPSLSQGTSRHTAGTGSIITNCRNYVTGKTVVLSHAYQTRCCADQEARPGRAVFFLSNSLAKPQSSDVTRLKRHVDRSSIIAIAGKVSFPAKPALQQFQSPVSR